MNMTRREFLKSSAAITGMAAVGGGLFSNLPGLQANVGMVHAAASGDGLIPSTCVMCVNFCGIRVSRVNGVIRQIYGNPESPYNAGHMCPKGQAGIFNTYNPYRVKAPLKRTNPNKGPGEDPKWVEITWEEALSTIADKLKKIKDDDPRKLVWLHGHGKYLVQDKFPKALWKAFGTPNVVHRTTICEVSRHTADELTWGYHGFLPDLDNCKMFLNFGGNFCEAGQFARWIDRKSLDAQENGMKNVYFDPRLANAGKVAGEWVPIKPAMDHLFLLAMANEMIANGHVDEDFLIEYTNAPNLVGSDNYFLKDGDGKELVWDKNSGSAKPYEDGVAPALEGTYTVDGKKYKTAFQVLKDDIKDVTPEYAAENCDVPASTIKRIAREFGEAASIGQTVVKDGKTIRYRPVSIYTFRGLSTHEYGTQINRARWIVQFLAGNVDAVGGVQVHSAYKKPAYFDVAKCEYPPNRVDLQESVYFPQARHNVAQQVGYTLIDPKAYGLEYTPEMVIAYATNRVFSAPVLDKQIEGYKKPYTVVIDIQLTEHADMADIVLPDKSYLEAWHWAPTRYTVDTKHDAIRQPVVNAYDLKYQEMDIFMELAERVGILGKFVETINKDWKTDLDTGKKHSGKDVVAAIAKAKGKDLEYLMEHGLSKKQLSVEDIYLKGVEVKFKGPGKPKMQFYCENLVGTADKVKEVVAANNITNLDISKIDMINAPLPRKEHAFQTGHDAPKEYDLYLITYKRMYYNQSGTAMNPRLRNVAHDSDDHFVLMNTATAVKKGIRNGDEVNVESRVGKIKIKAKLIEGIRPDTVGISYHYGHWSNSMPSYAKKGVNPNWIIELHSDMISGMTNFNDTKVKVYK